MANAIRLIALDLDGTLMTKGSVISDRNAAAIGDAVAAGVHVVIATSRWYRLARQTATKLGITSPIICHNGAMIRTPSADAPLLELTLTPEAAVAIATLADAARYESMVTVDDITYLMTKRADVDARRLPDGMVIAPELTSHVRDGAAGFLFFGQDAVDGIPAALDPRHAAQLNLAAGVSETFPPYLNIVHAAADKGRALEIVCNHVGVPLGETMAIGDAAPDLQMMRRAGLSVAMGNAPPDVKAQADVVGPGNLDDGVAWAIREYVLEK